MFRTCEYLTLCSIAGIIFKKKEFQFGQLEVDFLGFRITMEAIMPNQEIDSSIKLEKLHKCKEFIYETSKRRCECGALIILQ